MSYKELNKAYVNLFVKQNKNKLESAKHGSILHSVNILFNALYGVSNGHPDMADEFITAAMFELIGIYMVKEEPNE